MRVYETEAGQRLFDPVPARRENKLFDLTGQRIISIQIFVNIKIHLQIIYIEILFY